MDVIFCSANLLLTASLCFCSTWVQTDGVFKSAKSQFHFSTSSVFTLNFLFLGWGDFRIPCTALCCKHHCTDIQYNDWRSMILKSCTSYVCMLQNQDFAVLFKKYRCCILDEVYIGLWCLHGDFTTLHNTIRKTCSSLEKRRFKVLHFRSSLPVQSFPLVSTMYSRT